MPDDDSWQHHIRKLHLTDISQMAESVGYRIRAANTWQFDLEYVGNPTYVPSATDSLPQGAIGKSKSCAVLTFENSEQGKQYALHFIQSVPSIRSFLHTTEEAFRRLQEQEEQGGNEEWDMIL